jgi:hypothetical protein
VRSHCSAAPIFSICRVLVKTQIKESIIMSHQFGKIGSAARPLLIAAALAFVAPAISTPVLAAPQLTAQQEAKAHPRLVKGIKDMEGALEALTKAPDDFGGHKAKAESDLKVAIHSLKKALLYRLNMDDAAIDAAQF